MDLSRFKWPVILIVVIALIWLCTSGGVSFMYKGLLKHTPGQDAAKDATNEASLTRLGGFLIKTLRYKRAETVVTTAVQRYPTGRNVYYNHYRLAKCAEKRGNYRGAVNVLEKLIMINANSKDKRVPTNQTLRLRSDKLKETYGIGEVGGGY